MLPILIGYARCSTADQSFAAQRKVLVDLGIPASVACRGYRNRASDADASGGRGDASRKRENQAKGYAMKQKGRKNAAGAWLRGEFLGRIFSAGMLSMAVTGFVLGILVRELPWFDRLPAGLVGWAAVGVLVATLGTLLVYVRRVDATWGRGMEAERRVGDLIEHAVAQPGCAFAHDVKEALGGRGNVDHVVMTPAGVWVVETKAAWLSRRKFPAALCQAAENTNRVRRHLQTSLPVRGALVIADPEKGSHDADHDWRGEPVKAFGAKQFWSVLRAEVGQAPRSALAGEGERTARRVWGLGSMRYLDS